MKWLELQARIHVIEKFIGMGILALVALVLFGLWVFIAVSDWLYDRKRKKMHKK